MPIKGDVKPPEERFWPKVSKRPNGCWFWDGAKDGHGYGAFWSGERRLGAHRWAYEHWVGSIPQGFELDHFLYPTSCIGPSCVNPDHLRPASHRENTLRGDGVAASALAKTHCVHGHPFNEANTRTGEQGRLRRCLTCKREADGKRTRRWAPPKQRR